jgi:signal transduction histidine kinase
MNGLERQAGREPGTESAREVPLSRGLSTKLLLLTVLFVMLAEVLIFMPSVANFRLGWLEERLSTAAAVGVVLVESEPGNLSRAVQDDVLMAIGARAIAVRDEGASRLLVVSEMPPAIDEHVELTAVTPARAMVDALDTLIFGGDRMLRVFGPVAESDKEFEIVIADAGLRQAMLVYARNIAILSLIISLITAGLVFYAITRIMIRPIRAMTRAMLSFAQAPEDPSRVIRPSKRADEIGVAERQLAEMQQDLQRTLSERKHLADLGLAVSKINHDMRNMLTSAQLVSDRLRSVNDETVQRLLPKLVRAIDRAVSYSRGVLAYGRTQEAPPARRRLRLSVLVDEVFEFLDLAAVHDTELVNAVDENFEVEADADQLFRVLTNLGRNAVQAMAPGEGSAVVRRLTISAEREGSVARIQIEDTGPGLPQKARDNLFAAFLGAARSGGTGLGLAIAHELVRAHGGTIELLESRGGRTAFVLIIPDQPVDLEAARDHMRRPA